MIVHMTALSLTQRLNIVLSYGTSKKILTCPHMIGNCYLDCDGSIVNCDYYPAIPSNTTRGYIINYAKHTICKY